MASASCFALLLSTLLLAPQPAAGQAQTSSVRVRYTTEEGSWLSFDISPDRRWITLDLLGQLWRLPVTGGMARPLTNAVRDSAELLDPVYAPDGNAVIVHGEHGGRLGVFRINATGDSVRWIAPDTIHGFFRESVPSPSWRADGQHLLHSKREPNGNVVLVERNLTTGAERVVPVTGVDGIHRDGAIYSADGKEIYFNTRKSGDGIIPRAGRIWSVAVAGGSARLVSPAGLLARAPAPSPGGRRIAYFVIDSTNRAQVYVQHLGDSVGAPVTADVDITPTRIRWLTDDTLIYVESGRLWRLNVRTRSRQAIPFKATVDFARTLSNVPRVRFPAPGERVTARGMFGAALAPDGRAYALIALNKLWVVRADSIAASPRAIESVPATAASPSWSSDGRHIAWSAGPFRDEDLFVTDTLTRSTRRVTTIAGGERFPAWSPDGRQLLFYHTVTDTSGRPMSRRRVITVQEDALSSVAQTTDLGPAITGHQWSPRGDMVLSVGQQGNQRERPATLVSSDGATTRPVRGLPGDASLISWLTGDTLAYTAGSRLWRAPLHVATGVVGPATPISDETAASLVASARGHLLYISVDGFRLRKGDEPVRHLGWPLSYTVPTPKPLVIRNVRIIDGTGAPATRPRDIVIERGRITRVAGAGTSAIPNGAELIDAEGRTAIPGLIDLHLHAFTPAQPPAALYFGVTTFRGLGMDVGVGAGVSRDALAAGVWSGPRMTTGLRVWSDWAQSRDSTHAQPVADRRHLERTMGWIPAFGLDLLKIYQNNQFATQMRLIDAAHARGARATGHCGYPMALIAVGIDSKEHMGTQCTLRDGATWYDDLVQLYARSGTPIVPTLSLFTNWRRLRDGPLPFPSEVERLFGPVERGILVGSVGGGGVSAATLGNVDRMVDAVGKLHRAGALLGSGSDYELPGGVHYDLEALVEAGLSPLEAIRAATSVSARIMGADHEVGQIAPRFLGDIVILDADPTRDIRHTRRIWQVIQGGRVIDRRELVAPSN